MTKRFVGLSASAVLVVMLAGCYDLPNQLQGPVAIRDSDNGLEVLLCHSVEAANFILEVREDGKWERAWVAQGGADIVSGQSITAGSIGEVFPNATILSNEFGNATDISVVITAKTSDENVVAGFDASKLDSQNWLHPDDSLTATPCENS